MKVERFEDLEIYKNSRELTKTIYLLTRLGVFSKDYALRDQIRGATISITSNIAEGFERKSDTEFAQFLFYAKGSCGEVRSQLNLALDQGYISKEEHEKVYAQLVVNSRMMSTLIKYLRGK